MMAITTSNSISVKPRWDLRNIDSSGAVWTTAMLRITIS